ncbi:8491_t:CDS:1, partial [Paraglomus occultum]
PEPGSSLRSKLVEVCGPQYANSRTCCDSDQLDDLAANIKQVEALISSCPACWHNFLEFFCTFTCSPDQSLFVNVTSTGTSQNNQTIVTRVDFFVDKEYGKGFYDSCKDIKFAATNGYVMDFIGGGAKDYHEMLVYLGTERPVGSPFQIDFPLEDTSGAFHPLNIAAKQCNATDTDDRCSCVDCQSVCPLLDPTPEEKPRCTIGFISCWSFALLLVYGGLILGLAFAIFIKRLFDEKRDRAGFEP